MEYIAVIILVDLTQFTFFTIRTGLARITYGVKAPSTAGHETWERLYRIHQNTMEQLIVFIPGMVIFEMYVSKTWALLPGIVFIVGRGLYSFKYLKDPASRVTGMALAFLRTIGLALLRLYYIANLAHLNSRQTTKKKAIWQPYWQLNKT